MSTPSATRVGIVGTGEMGRPVVERLRSAGFAVAAYARRDDARPALVEAGVEVVGSPAALGAASDVVLVYVFADEQVRSVALDDGLLDAMAPGSVLVVHTTGSPATAQALAAHATPRGVAVLDAAGSGGPADVAAGRLNLFVGGDDTDLARCRPVFDAYASAITHVGPVGAGQMVKLVNNLLFGSHIQLALEATRIAEQFGVDGAELSRVLHTCSGQSYSLDLVAAMGSVDRLVDAAGRFIHKDVVVARAVAAELGVDLGTFDAVTAPLLDRTRPTQHP